MKSLMELWITLAKELAGICHTSATRDCKTVSRRVKAEGMSFFTISLPSFGKDFERSLDQGKVDRQDFQGFKWNAGLPVLLQGFLSRVFDTSSGRLLDDPDIDAIQAIRQLTLIFGKMFMLPTKERERAAMSDFIKCEQEVEASMISYWSDPYFRASRDRFRIISNSLYGLIFRDIEKVLDDPLKVLPMHGPGATADRKIGNAKYYQNTWPKRLEAVFHAVDCLIPSQSYYDELDQVHFLEPWEEIPVRVISVPKTQKTPRIIAIEPTAMQYAQQAVRKLIYEKVERDNLLKTFIGFLDQTPNQELAQEGSHTGELATLDMSEASDRVSCLHVDDLLCYNPILRDAVMACRSSKADVSGHGVITLSKFASMGSALTFPMEAMVFLAIIFVAIESDLNRPLSRKDFKSYLGKVRVFGDDIIVPVKHVESTIRYLELFGLKVNRRKSFWTGKFRESCGKEFYSGHDVSIVRVRREAPTSLTDVEEISSWVDLSNQMYFSGYWKTVKWLDRYITEIIHDFPVVLPTSPVLGRHSFMGYDAQKVGGRYQIPLVKGLVRRDHIPKNSLDGHRALLKVFLERGNEPLFQTDHLERSGRPRVGHIKRGWFSAV